MNLAKRLLKSSPNGDNYAAEVVDEVLHQAITLNASDIHLEQQPGEVLVRYRVGGSLLPADMLPDGSSTKVLSRIKALARLVTYRSDIPQEGRIVLRDKKFEGRVSTLPTLHGERAVIRLVSRSRCDWLPSQLGWSAAIQANFEAALARPSGVILISGIAGSGKTTTAYAGLRHLLQSADYPRSLVSLEDPIEAEISGVSQSQINPSVGYQWTEGLKALVRQDPEVMFVGEVRDSETAQVVFQAAMMGQVVDTTLHAKSVGDAVRRLLDFDVPAHHLLSGIAFLNCQRLLPSLCGACSSGGKDDTTSACEVCGGSRVGGRLLVSEQLPEFTGGLTRTVIQDLGADEIYREAQKNGMVTLRDWGSQKIASGEVSPSQLKRYLS